MLRSLNKYLFIPAVVGILLYNLNPLFAQEKGFYEGPFNVLNYHGNAAYGFEYTEKDTVLNGSFLFQNSNLEALLTKKDSTFLIDGAFEMGYATGFWKFRFGVFQAQPESRVVDYQYRISASGVQEEVQGLLLRGKPDGPWNYSVQSIKEAAIVNTLFKSSISFKNGIPQQNIRIENDTTVLVGRFLRNGFAQDEWELYEMDKPDPVERWIFNDGVLERIAIRVNGKEQTLPVFNSSSNETKEVVLDARFLRVLEAKLASVADQANSPNHIIRLLTQNAIYYQKLDAVLAQLGSASLSPNFGVRLPYYPMDSIAKGYISSIVENVTSATAISDAYLDNPLLNILKLSDAEALRLYTALKRITKEQLVPLQKLVGYHQNELLEFLTNEDILINLWPNGINESTRSDIETIAKNIGFDSNYNLAFDFESNTMASIAMLARYTAEHTAFIENELKEKLSKQLQEQERIALDEQLLAQNKQLTQFIDSIGTTLPVKFQKALASVQRVTVANLSTVSTEEDLELARELVLCHETMHELATTVAAQPARTEELTKLYEDRIWNPFMATLMDEAVKKRITSAYKKVLIPYFLEQINTELSCDNVDDINLLLNALYSRMLELRNEDTKKLERKLRNETDVLKIQELFRLRPVEKNPEE